MPISASKIIKYASPGILLLALLLMGTTPGMAFKEFSQSFGVAIRGYDPVAYQTEGRALKGKKEFFYDWNDATWRFASAENRDLFAADPERYATQYGGY